MDGKLNVIKCPKCGKEYLPAEIFVPKSFFGSPQFIERNVDGTIRNHSGQDMDLNEVFTCDSCETTFDVKAILNFETSINVKHDFSEDYTSSIASRFTLKEF